MLREIIFHPFSGGITAKYQNSVSLSGAADTGIRRIQNICILRRNGGKMILISDKFWFMEIIKNMKNEFVKVHAGRGRCMQAMI